MSQFNASSPRPPLLNVPNQVTIARLALTVVLFVCLESRYYAVGLALFLIAAATDWFDGYWARKYGQVTQLGRILDPFADKLIICGTFVYLAASPQEPDGSPVSRVTAWMAVLVFGRELIVTALRSFIEQSGGDFSAKWAGKWKMVIQCAAVALSLVRLMCLGPDASPPIAWTSQYETALTATLWGALALTVYSGIEYIVAAIGMLRRSS